MNRREIKPKKTIKTSFNFPERIAIKVPFLTTQPKRKTNNKNRIIKASTTIPLLDVENITLIIKQKTSN
jgi:hypothetical protein